MFYSQIFWCWNNLNEKSFWIKKKHTKTTNLVDLNENVFTYVSWLSCFLPILHSPLYKLSCKTKWLLTICHKAFNPTFPSAVQYFNLFKSFGVSISFEIRKMLVYTRMYIRVVYTRMYIHKHRMLGFFDIPLVFFTWYKYYAYISSSSHWLQIIFRLWCGSNPNRQQHGYTHIIRYIKFHKQL